jgi:hypothetical protein
MTGSHGDFMRTFVPFVLLLSLGILLPLSGTAFADLPARAAGEETPESIGPHRHGGEPVSPERLERWRAMPPAERERIRERYRRWKELPPEKRERIRERHRRWRELPEEQRRYLTERRALLKDAGPEERAAVHRFFDRMRSLPPEARRAARQRIREGGSLPPGERDEALRSLPFYNELADRDRAILRWFLFARPGERPPDE